MFDKLPSELREKPQWVNWTLETIDGAETKIPRQSSNGYRADITRPDHWSTFDLAVANHARGLCSGIGYAIAREDGLTFIDIDAKAANAEQIEDLAKIITTFESYAEVSPSGKGWHIIVRGKLPFNVKTSFVEIYSFDRYMTCTGNVYLDKPIIDAQFKLEELARELGAFDKKNDAINDRPEVITDEELMQQAASAKNGETFMRLFSGDIAGYPSQSEADQALMNIIAFYTDNSAQAIRVFRMSQLGQREKAQRDSYVGYTVRKAFDQKIPTEFLDDAFARTREQMERAPEPAQELQGPPLTVPPGIMGELARYVYANAPRPVPEIAIVAALGMMSSIGRAYNVNGSGLNLYTMLVAPTGTGKDAVHSGINSIVESLRPENSIMHGVETLIGPAGFASPQGLLRTFEKQKSFVSIMGEFGLTMAAMAHPRASSSDRMLMRVLLDIFSKSGKGDKIHPTNYADKMNNIPTLNAPSLSLVGETTPQTLKETIDESVITSGLFPRFVIVEYTGPRPPSNSHRGQTPLYNSEHIRSFFLYALDRIVRDAPQDVSYHPDAWQMLETIDKQCDEYINASGKETVRHIWNRAHLNVLKIAALTAVGVDYTNPVITVEHVTWARDIVFRSAHKVTRDFVGGLYGDNGVSDQQRNIDACSVMLRIQQNGVVSHRIFAQRIYNYVSFRKSPRGSGQALRDVVTFMVDSGIIMEVNATMAKTYGVSGKAYVIMDYEGLSRYENEARNTDNG